MSSNTWLPESATEWIDSASIDEEPVSANAPNFVTAMPRLAPSAARIAFVPPSVLMPGRPDGSAPVAELEVSASSAGELLHLLDGRNRRRVEAVGHGQIDRGEVGDRDE